MAIIQGWADLCEVAEETAETNYGTSIRQHRSQLSLLVGEALASPGEAFNQNGEALVKMGRSWRGLS